MRLFSGQATLTTRDGSSLFLEQTINSDSEPTRELVYLILYGIRFRGISLVFSDTGAAKYAGNGLNAPEIPYAIRSVNISNCSFENGNARFGDSAPQIHLNRVQDALVANVNFTRDASHVGKAVALSNTRRVRIMNSRIDGFYKSAIHMGGAARSSLAPTNPFPNYLRNYDILISGNVIHRRAGTDAYPEDHGIYAWGMNTLKIEKNTISGWSPTSAGGSLKIRNGENILVQDNVLLDSGIYLLTYLEIADGTGVVKGNLPVYMRNATILRNKVTMPTAPNTPTGQLPAAIIYWKNVEAADLSPDDEQNILMQSNTVTDGRIAVQASYNGANGSAFRLVANQAPYFFIQPRGVFLDRNLTTPR